MQRDGTTTPSDDCVNFPECPIDAEISLKDLSTTLDFFGVDVHGWVAESAEGVLIKYEDNADEVLTVTEEMEEDAALGQERSVEMKLPQTDE